MSSAAGERTDAEHQLWEVERFTFVFGFSRPVRAYPGGHASHTSRRWGSAFGRMVKKDPPPGGLAAGAYFFEKLMIRYP